MKKRQVLLVCSQYLFGEGLHTLLKKADDVELIGPWALNDDFFDLLASSNLDVVIIADEDPNSAEIVNLANTIMSRFPDLPIIRIGLTQNIFHIVETHAFPASSSDLIETIRGLSDKNQ
jgi:DNA-binding NarL/FixJ family response regulator